MEYSYITFAILGMVLSIISQIGDFVASIIKRFVDKCYIHLSFLQSSLDEWSSKINFVVRMCVCTYKL